jgi:hypothetical protein
VTRGLAIALGLTAVGSVATAAASIVAAQRGMSMTLDEPTHIASGLEWLQHGSYTMWTENPPLPRVAVALGLLLSGARLPEAQAWDPHRAPAFVSTQLGAGLIYGGGSPRRDLGRARLPGVLFFLMAVGLTALLAARQAGWTAGAAAAVALAGMPPVLAHASVATTDVAFVAAFLFAVWAMLRWREEPSVGRTGVLGLAVGLSLLCKFTTLLFLPAVVLAVALASTRAGLRSALVDRRRWLAVGTAAAVAGLVVWTGYRFSFGRVTDPRFAAPTESRHGRDPKSLKFDPPALVPARPQVTGHDLCRPAGGERRNEEPLRTLHRVVGLGRRQHLLQAGAVWRLQTGHALRRSTEAKRGVLGVALGMSGDASEQVFAEAPVRTGEVVTAHLLDAQAAPVLVLASAARCLAVADRRGDGSGGGGLRACRTEAGASCGSSRRSGDVVLRCR